MAEWRDRNRDLIESDKAMDPKKVKAMAEIAEWQKRNKLLLDSNIDWEEERAAALEEKYGPFN